jgi:uncharacterized protein
MLVMDPVYGKFDITEPVLLDLIKDKTVQRVADIMQGATTAPINNWPDFSRLEHCIGTMLIVRTAGGDLEAQIAALLHDISHTAFSHVTDFVYSKGSTQDYHEDIKDSIIVQSDIPAILAKYNFSLKRIMNDDLFPLHELPSPDICADRVDYALRIVHYYFSRPADAKRYFKALITENNRLIFSNEKDAVDFSRDFYLLDTTVLTDKRNLAAYYVFADAIKRAIDIGYISDEDLLSTDAVVWKKLMDCPDETIYRLMHLLKPEFNVTEDSEKPDYTMKGKPRWVNPLFISEGKLKRVFEVNKDLETKFTAHKEFMKTPVSVRIVC